MVKNMSLRMKLFILITLVVIVAFSIVSAVVSYRSIEMAKEDAFMLVDEMSAKYSYEIRSELQAARVTSESLMTVFKTLIERDEADRDTLNAILRNSLMQKEYIISFCVAFEPNKLDGKDAEYAGQYPLYDDTGRYAPYWSLQDGVLDVEPLSNFDEDVWYAGARDTGGEYITDPFIYEVQGEPVLMTSLVFPILIDDEFIGIVSSDMALDSLQEMVSHVNTSGLDEYTEIYSNSGIVVAHPDDRFFNKDIYAASACNMLLDEPSKAKEALEIAGDYLAGGPARADGDGASSEESEADAAFADSLRAYAENPQRVQLDLSLLTNGMARAILALDEGRLEIAREATQAIADGETYTVSADGYYKVYTPIQFSEATNPWSVAVNIPMASVLQKSNEIRNYVILVAVVSILLIAAMLYFITRNLTKPILRLADSAKRVGEGNFNVDIPTAKGNDEIGILSTAFRTMVGQINDLVGDLTQNSQELERKNEHLGELNEMLMEARDQAEAANRAKSAFLSNMSHEMRTPLNAITGMAAIGVRTADENKKNHSFAKIEEASAHLLSLVNDILDMSKLEANTLEITSTAFSARKVIEEARESVAAQLEAKAQTLDASVDSEIPDMLSGDALRLSQVLRQLLSNAVKFTGEQGKIGLRAFVRDQDSEACTLQFEITDTGIGISAEQQANLFRVFEQADNSASRSFGGTGLGLALSKRLVSAMGGDIWVESVLGKGSTFLFTVRLGRCGQRTSRFEESQRDYAGKRALLAEDNEVNQEIVLAMLEMMGLEADCAENGKEAYDMFIANPGRYNLILMDIQMPVMDGVEATELIRKSDSEIPIIAVTANLSPDDVKKYIQSGINNYIGKPLSYERFLEVLGEYLR